ncbi:uncharacterized protein LOC101855963 isoform X1 [Aplysia californica]|uniref:Uncharacterized protein LOC101855963 isoform X1 n=1 Tax=Aplysia californica TaxID=6500 RepID=A0ABM0JX33_APLCA|nr:uncharacterized protein LOC101855963 isoform X1 [Aplysia californica]
MTFGAKMSWAPVVTTAVLLFLCVGEGLGAIIDKEDFEVGTPLTITCSKNAAPQIPDIGNTISKITLSRTTENTEELLATYHPANSFEKYEETRPITNGVYEMTGGQNGNIIGNANNIILRMTIDPAQCSDSAMYKCTFFYYNTDSKELEAAFTDNTTAIAKVQDMAFLALPDEFEYVEGVNITFTCRVMGHENLRIEWKAQMCPIPGFTTPGFQTWPRAADIKDMSDQTPPASQCTAMNHQSELFFSVDGEFCAVKCEVYSTMAGGLIPQQSVNKTVTISDGSSPAPNQGNPDSGELGIGPIIGIVIAVLGVIVIVLLLVYFCWYRKRDKEDKYRDTEDGPNNTSNDPYAPPPVFYTKPNKTVSDDKDEKTHGKDYDSGNSRRSKDPYDDAAYSSRGQDDYEDRHKDQDARPRARPRSRDRGDTRRSRDYDSRQERGAGEPKYYEDEGRAYASTDISRSEDESADNQTRYKPKPKRRSRAAERDAEQEKPLHYAELDLPPSRGADSGGRRGRDRDRERDRGRDPVEYASIRV